MLEIKLADKLTAIACKQLAAGVQFRQPRMVEIAKAVDLYNNKTKPALRGRFNVPIPMMGGFVDTLMSKIDDPPKITYNPTEEADTIKSKKIQSAWEIDANKGRWEIKDRAIKKLAIFSGRGIAKIFSESKPTYQNHFEPVDYMDFVAEPQGGGNLEDHLFCGQENIFRTWNQLETAGKSGLYDISQVRKLKANTHDVNYKKNEEIFQNKQDRYGALGLDADTNNYVGQDLYNLTEWGMVYNGKRYYLLFDYPTGTWVRAEELKDVFKSDLWPWISFATHEDAFNFWSKAPCDDMRPVASAVHTIFNQVLENINKKNWHGRAYDPEVFTNPSQLKFTPEGLAQATPKPGKSIKDGIMDFETPEIAGSVNLIGFINSFAGEKTAITPSAQGTSDQQRVGIYYGDLQQVADRLGLYSKAYKDFYHQAGVRYIHGLDEHMPQKMMVKYLGEEGLEWDYLRKDEIPSLSRLDIEVIGGRAEAEADELKKKSKAEAIGFIYKFPELRAGLNHSWSLEELLANGGYDDSAIRIAKDVQGGAGDREMRAIASEENQRIFNGKDVPPNRKATTAHLQKHLDFADDLSNEIERSSGKAKEKNQKAWADIMQHFQAEIPFAQQTMFRKANELMLSQALMQGEGGGGRPTTPPVSPQAQPEERPQVNVPSNIAGTQRRSQTIAGGLRPNE